MKTRRELLATLGVAAVAGCSSNNDSNGTDTPPDTTTTRKTTEKPESTPEKTPEGTETPEETTTEENTTEETTTEKRETIAGVEVAEMEHGFEEIYRETFNQDTDHLNDYQKDKLQAFVPGQPIRQLNQIAKWEAREGEGLGNPWQQVRTFREVMHNELDYSIDELILSRRITGGRELYGANFEKKDGDWIKHMSRGGAHLAFRHRDREEQPLHSFDALVELWKEDKLQIGAATGVEKWREGVEKGGTREEYDDPKWLIAGSPPDINNDTMIIDYDRREAEKDWFGKIGYTREGIETVGETQDWLENETFNQEVEILKNLTEFFHNTLPTPYGKDIPIDEETYIRVGTRSEIEEDLKQGTGENPYQIAESTEKELWAINVGYEEHKKDTFNWGIPESHWPEKAYPDEGVKLPEKYRESDLWTWEEEEEQ
ncbi:hypothetical protein [Halapricum desulfuricans]|uniref:Uncharacterized protein n=1 Tax=Halapricum desulfuricans TaxID=2841257 RepID=A0A897N7U7_9EURY|nr:hypothetical protein [Halapricum desulfuricans]QSG07253.1 hypothetical protein HSR121_2936 [Halapricum desulfuricans]